MGILSFLGFGNGIKDALRNGAVIIDVRSAQEFDRGRVPGAINIPVDRVASNADRIKHMNKPIIFCCSSGHRSRQAANTLKAKGMKNVYSAGNWEKLWQITKSL